MKTIFIRNNFYALINLLKFNNKKLELI